MRLLLLAGVFVFASMCSGQYWKALGKGTIGATSVQALYGDTVSNRLLAGGTFAYIKNESDTVFGCGQAAWNGIRWDSLATRIQDVGSSVGAQQTFWFLRFEGNLYACGAFTFSTPSGNPNRGFAKLNETTQIWEALSCLNPVMSGLSMLQPREQPQSALYATGFEQDLCGYPAASVFRYDGSAFHEWPPFAQIPPDGNGNLVNKVFDYNGYTYMTGLFRDPLQSEGNASFMRFNGTTWEYVPGWGDQTGPIKEISIRNDTLYVAGAFTTWEGGPGNGIASFNGNTWNDMGGGLRLSVAPTFTVGSCFAWFHNELYVAGQFDEAGGIPCEGMMVKWNGRQWCSLPGEFRLSNGLLCQANDIAVWRDSLYLSGNFRTIDGDTMPQVAQWIGGDAVVECSDPVGIQEHDRSSTFSAFPNPTTAYFTLHGLPPHTSIIVVRDVLGREVLRNAPPFFHLDASGLPAATYLISALDSDGMELAVTRFMKR